MNTNTSFLGARPDTGGINTVTTKDLVHDLKTEYNRYNDGCGGHVWAIGDLGNATDVISGVPPSADHMSVYIDTSISIVYFDLSPCGVHPWHVHQQMNEYVFVSKGSGRLSLISPHDQSVEMLAVQVGDLVTLPQSWMHQFEASAEGLELIAFGNVNDAHLALVPLFMAMQPPPVQRALDTISPNKGSTTFFSKDYPWSNNMKNGPGAAFLCGNTTTERDGAGCPLQPDTPGQFCESIDGTQNCTEYSNPNAKYYAPFTNIASCQSDDRLSTGCTCQYNGAVCQLQPPRTSWSTSAGAPMLYARLELENGGMIGPALQPRGGIGGYVTSGRIWVMFLNPNFGYASQFIAEEGQTFYIPPDVYVNILGMDSDNTAVMGISKQQWQDDQDVGVFVPFGPMLNTVPANVLRSYFGWDNVTAEAFVASSTTAIGSNVMMIPDLIPWVEALKPDQVLCPTTNEFCTSQLPLPDTTLVYGNILPTNTNRAWNRAENIAISALAVACVDLLLLLLFLCRRRQAQ